MINEKLKAAREERGWKKAKIGQYLEVADSVYWNWENRSVRPNEKNLIRLCELLKKTKEELGF